MSVPRRYGQDVTPQTKFLMVSVFPQNVRDILLDPNVILYVLVMQLFRPFIAEDPS